MALNRRERYLLVTPVVLGAAIGFYTYLYQPLAAALARSGSDLAATRAQISKDQARLKKEGDLGEREIKLSQRLQDLARRVGGRRSAAVLVYYLARAEKESGVTIRQISLTFGKQEGDLLPVSLALQADGSFLSHILFIQASEGVPVFLAGERLDLDRSYQTVAATVKDPTSGPSPSVLAGLPYAPPESGNYRFVLYFKPDSDRPDTSVLSFPDAPGRNDPFAEATAAALLADLQTAFPKAKLQLPTGIPQPATPAPAPTSNPQPAQLG